MRTLIVVAGVGAIALALAVFTFVQSRVEEIPVIVAHGPVKFSDAVVAPGRVEAVSGIRNLSFDVPGRIRKVYVEQGQGVTAGQLIAELEDEVATARRDAARAEWAEAQAQYAVADRNLQTGITRAEQEVVRLKAELALLIAGPRHEQVDAARAEAASAAAEARMAAEDEDKFAKVKATDPRASSQKEYDNAHRRAEALAAKFDAAKARVTELESGSRPQEIDRAKAALNSAEAEVERLRSTHQLQLDIALAQTSKAKANLESLEAELKRMRITAPVAGVIVWKFCYGGEVINAIQQQPVVSIASTDRLQIRSSVDEADYPKVFCGQQVKITADAFGDRYFRGHVMLLGNSAGEKPFTTGDVKEKQDVRVVEAIVELDEPAALKLGLRVTTRFDAEH